MAHDINANEMIGTRVQKRQQALYLAGCAAKEHRDVPLQGLLDLQKDVGQITLDIFAPPELGDLLFVVRALMAGKTILVEANAENNAPLIKNALGDDRKSAPRCALRKNVGAICLYNVTYLGLRRLYHGIHNRADPLAAVTADAGLGIDARV